MGRPIITAESKASRYCLLCGVRGCDHVLHPPLVRYLSRMQQRVLCHVATGTPNKIIAHELGLTESTVKQYIHQAIMRLRNHNPEIHNRVAAAIWAHQRLEQLSKP